MFKLQVLLPILAVMLLLRWRKVGMLTWVLAWMIGMFVFFKAGFAVGIPANEYQLARLIRRAGQAHFLFRQPSGETARTGHGQPRLRRISA